MNETINCILTRRSIRKFSSSSISDEDLALVVKAGEYAPSAMGKQNRIILVIKDKKVREEIQKRNASIMGCQEDFDPFYNAPVVIVVLAPKSSPTKELDGAAVIENMLLASHSLGLGSCWIHRAKEEFDSEWGKSLLLKLGIKGEYEAIDHIALGYYDKNNEPVAMERKENSVYYI